MLRVEVQPPYDFHSILRFLKPRSIAGVEWVEEETYFRSVRVGEVSGWVAVRYLPQAVALHVEVSPSLRGVEEPLLRRLGSLFDVGFDPSLVQGALGPLAAPHPGLRVPGAFDGFEMAVRAILGQQISVRFATTLAGRFADAFGEPIDAELAQISTVFPRAERIAEATQDDVARLGIIGSRARAIIRLAQEIAFGGLVLDDPDDIERSKELLLAIPGIGEWTVQYIAMRALRDLDAFPATDLGVYKALGVRSGKEAAAMAEGWRPWRSYGVMYLWKSLESLA